MSICPTDSVATPINFVQNEVATNTAQIPGLQQLWSQTLGDPRICIAILDGLVDLSHPAFSGAALTQLSTEGVTKSDGYFSDHGTHVTSIIFGQHDSSVKGIAPRCRGLIVPIFDYAEDGSLKASSQQRLARAILAALHHGANIINISGGQFSSDGQASGELMAAVAACEGRAIIIAAAGNDGCDCLHIPGAMPSVLAVGAMDTHGEPLPFSNWGETYQKQGVLAPGARIVGASLNGGVARYSGTSFATPIVSGVAGLLLSLQQKLGIVSSAKSIRTAILTTTHGCDPQTESQCERVLAGRLNISGSASAVSRGSQNMQHATNNPVTTQAVSPSIAQTAHTPVESVEASACCGGCAGTGTQLVYAIGEVDYDFPSLSRLNSLQQTMATLESTGQQLNVQNRLDFARHLCGFREYKLKAASGLLSWNRNNPTDTVDGDTGLRFQITSADNLAPEDNFRRVLIEGVRERKRRSDGTLGPWQPWRLNGAALPIGQINPASFILRTFNPPSSHSDRYDFENATFVLVRDPEKTPRVHPAHEYDAQSVVWKLRRGSTNLYAIKPGGNYSEAAYGELIDFLLESQGFERSGLDLYYFDTPHGRRYWNANWNPEFNARDCCLANEGGGSHKCCTNYQSRVTKVYPPRQGRFLERTQRVSVPGTIAGNVQLLNGEVLTEIAPDMRGTHSWSLARLHGLIKETIENSGNETLLGALLDVIMPGMDQILTHLDERVRNRGASSQDRALNYAATRMVDILPDIAGALVASNGDPLTMFELDEVSTPVRSAIGHPGTDCWDVEIAFFNPNSVIAARMLVSQTVDVSDVIPYRIEDPKIYRKR